MEYHFFVILSMVRLLKVTRSILYKLLFFCYFNDLN